MGTANAMAAAHDLQRTRRKGNEAITADSADARSPDGHTAARTVSAARVIVG